MKNYQIISEVLKDKDYKESDIDIYIAYLRKTESNPKNSGWFNKKTEDDLINYFIKVQADGFNIDGEHITIQSTGICYDYVAYKNKMLAVYSESIIDIQMVYNGDTFKFSKESGKVKYVHNISNPFGQDENSIIGGYCVIKNQRGEFLTILNRQDLEKHRKTAKTDFIWKNWLTEMYFKTLMKKACKQHFADMYQNIEKIDNENYNPEKVDNTASKIIDEVSEITDYNELKEYYDKNKAKYKSEKKIFNKIVSEKRDELKKAVVDSAAEIFNADVKEEVKK